MGGARGHLFDFRGLDIDKTVQGSPWGDALQQADSDVAVERFWRYVKIWPFLWYAYICRNVSAVLYLPEYIAVMYLL